MSDGQGAMHPFAFEKKWLKDCEKKFDRELSDDEKQSVVNYIHDVFDSDMGGQVVIYKDDIDKIENILDEWNEKIAQKKIENAYARQSALDMLLILTGRRLDLNWRFEIPSYARPEVQDTTSKRPEYTLYNFQKEATLQ